MIEKGSFPSKPFSPINMILKSISRRIFLFLAIPLAFAALSNRTFAAEKPNVVLIMTDDQGYGDLSCHGNPVLKTPNLDQLFSEAVRLTDYHVAPTCSPTRCALLTGHWTNRTGVWHTIAGRSMMRRNEVTIGQIFSDGGYATGMFGKWHLGDNYPFRPEDRGFQEVLRHGGGGVGQTPDYWDNAYFDGSYFHNSKPEAVEGFCTDVFFSYAKQFVEKQASAGKPFFAYIATNAPHGPMHSPPEFAKPYEDQGLNTNLAHFFGMIANIDHNVGELRKWLAEKGLTENTLFIFTTDNGSSSGSRTFNAGMRGAKGSEYDGGHRVPFFIHWPRGGFTGGRDVEPITAHVDVVPTLIDICGLPAPKGVKFDGTSILPLLDDKVDADWPDRILVTDSQRVKDPIKWRKSAVMTSDWRLVSQEAGKKGGPNHALFAIKDDPGQKNDVITEHPEVAERLKKFYEDWWAELLPTFDQDARIVLGNDAENPAALTSHDWITVAMTPWNHSHIRKGELKPQNTGFWNVEVEKAGEYEIELRRWPRESKTAITAGMEPGAEVPGAPAFRARPGFAFPATEVTLMIGNREWTQKVKPGAKKVSFKVNLEKGPDQMSALFTDSEGNAMGAFYAYVKRVP